MTISRSALAATLAAKHDIAEEAAAKAVDIYADQTGAAADDLSDEDAESIDLSLQAHMAHDTGAPLDRVMAATVDRQEAEAEWLASIRAAVADGQRVVDIAEAAGISRERVYQIRDGRR